jgi:hypothetical protein
MRAVLSLLSGSWGMPFLLLLLFGLPIQAAVGGLVGLGRRIPAFAALFLPLLALIMGYVGMITGMNTAIAGLAQAPDPAWVPWFALDDRARAALPAALGGGSAALLALPAALGAAWVNVRAGAATAAAPTLGARARHWGLAGVGLAGTAVVAGIEAGLALFGDGAAVLWLPVLGALPFAAAAAVTALPVKRRDLAPLVIGYGALGIASLGLATAAAGFAYAAVPTALGDFSAPFAAVEDVLARTHAFGFVARAAAAAAVGFVAVLLPALLVRDWRRVDARAGTDTLVCAALALLALVAGVWGGARARVLSHYAGGHGVAVLDAAPGYTVPARAPLPARVLVGPALTPRWLLLRDRGGVESLAIVGGLDIVGPALLRGDGLMLPPELPLEDFYLALFESDAGRISVVGCPAVAPALRAELRQDPLLATGRCAAFPLDLRVTTALDGPRVLIALADGFVDDGGDVVPLAELRDVAGRDVVLRGQLDATVKDLVGVLGALGEANNVYLGWGVTVEGANLPIGVDPGLRLQKSAFAPLPGAEMEKAEPLQGE